ncbi:MAG TPA: hypothetical protein VJX30_11455, partial [Terriglobales bacterium]|nr:hypothetical protein [Terriglobales bacterium]
IRSEGDSNHAPEESPVAKARAATASIAKASTTNPSTAQAEAMTSHRLGADLIARDTVTYFDERASNETALRAKPAKRFAQQHQRSGKYSGGVIAANTVTYFDKKPTRKAANQNSGVKRQAEPN